MVTFWFLSGTRENWRHTLNETEHLWAARDSPRLRPVVQRICRWDILVFYATKPVGGVVGFGLVESERFTGDKEYWPDERQARKVLYPHRFRFSIVEALPEKQWESKALSLDEIPLRLGIQWPFLTLKEEQFKSIVGACDKKWMTNVSSELEKRISAPKEEPKIPVVTPEKTDHKSIIEMISEIGRLKRLVVEKEYPIKQSLDIGNVLGGESEMCWCSRITLDA